MSDDEYAIGLFEEPADFRPPPPTAHFTEYKREYAVNSTEISDIRLRLVGASPLWGHLLWNAGLFTANFIDQHPEYVTGKRVFEFGSAAALPSLLSCLNDAEVVIASDYPEPQLLNNIKYNVENLGSLKSNKIVVEEFIWGHDVTDIRGTLGGDGYADFLIMSDLVFNHSEHLKLLKSCKELIKPLVDGVSRSGGKCLVVFSPHRPWLLDDDLKFLETAKVEFGFDVEEFEMVHWEVPMFPEEEKETEEIRKRIYSFMLHPTW